MGVGVSVRQDEPFEIQPRANGAMATVLQRASVVALVLGLVGALAPGPVGPVAAWGAVGCVIAVPLARVGWLAFRWIARRDYRYAVTAFGLLGVVAIGGVAAVVQSG